MRFYYYFVHITDVISDMLTAIIINFAGINSTDVKVCRIPVLCGHYRNQKTT